MIEIRAARDEAEAQRVLGGISHYFGTGPEPTWAERIVPLSSPERFHGAWDGDVVVGGTGTFPLRADGARRRRCRPVARRRSACSRRTAAAGS